MLLTLCVPAMQPGEKGQARASGAPYPWSPVTLVTPGPGQCDPQQAGNGIKTWV